MAGLLQHSQAAQRTGLPSASARKHRADGPETNDALTITPDHPTGARHGQQAVAMRTPREAFKLAA